MGSELCWDCVIVLYTKNKNNTSLMTYGKANVLKDAWFLTWITRYWILNHCVIQICAVFKNTLFRSPLCKSAQLEPKWFFSQKDNSLWFVRWSWFFPWNKTGLYFFNLYNISSRAWNLFQGIIYKAKALISLICFQVRS